MPDRPPTRYESPCPDRTGGRGCRQPHTGIPRFDSGVRPAPRLGRAHGPTATARQHPGRPVMPNSGATSGAVLDHMAHAVPRWQDVWGRYAVDFGAQWSSGGLSSGFAPGQLRFANGARLEMLMPHDTGSNDFLERFLAALGPGPHHLTFKVPSLTDTLDRVRAHGLEPIGIDLGDPEWMEAFLHPKIATGVVVQLAEAPVPWSSPPPPDFPTGHRLLDDASGP